MYMINEFLKLVRLFDSNPPGKYHKQKILLNSFLFLSITVSLIFFIFYALKSDWFMGISLAVYASGTLVLLIYNNKSESPSKKLLHAVFSFSLLLVMFLAITGGSTGIAIFWAILFPIAALTIFESSRMSFIYSAILLALIGLLFVASPQGDFFHEYAWDTKIRFTLIYLSVMVLLSVFSRVNMLERIRAEKEYLDHKKEIQEKNQLISDLSFKLRSPLNHLVGILNLKEDTPTDDLLEEVELSVDNLVNLVNTIPSLSGVKGLKVKKRRTLFSLQKNIRKTIELFQTEDYKRLKIHLNLSGQLPSKIYADITILKQIIISVIDFYHHNSDEKTLNLEFIAGRKSVSDRGCEILFKIQSAKPISVIENNKSGNFINNIYDIDLPELAFIDRQIKKMNGKLNLYSDDSGTAFLFSIEAGTDMEVKNEIISDSSYKPGEVKISPKENGMNLSDVNLLLAEDDKVNQKIMVLTLKKYVKSIEVAQNGKEAIERFGQKKYDIILMDIRMPFMDGYKTARKIRETEAGTGMHVPIIAVTANALEGDKEKCLEAGMDDYMSKPMKTEELLEKMRKLIN